MGKVTTDTKIYDDKTPKAGHNSGFARAQLISTVEHIERLEEEQAALTEDKKEVYSEAKGVGFDTKTIRKLIQLRKMDPADRKEQAALLDLYLEATKDMPSAK